MATITAQAITESGKNDVSYSSAAAEGDAFENTGNQILHIKNGSGESITVTIVAETTSVDIPQYGTLTKANQTIAVGASGDAFIGTFPQSPFNDEDALVQITYSGVTSLTLAVLTVKHSQ
tara:strand:- start:1560 stop:1919 length:360 start_codon:yes stop_codon:yes gene_type:complete